MRFEEFLAKRWVRRLLLQPAPFWQGQLVAFLSAAAAAALRLALEWRVGDGVPFLTFFPAVVVASVVAGPLAGFSALALSTGYAAAFAWRESVDLAPSVWLRGIAFWLLCGLLIVIVSLLRALAQTLAASEEHAHMLARESAHRTRNVLGLVQAMARQTARGAADMPSFLKLLDARLAALGRAQELLAGPQADVRAFLERVVEPFGLEKFALVGPPTAVPEEHGVSLALVVHELATNALKYGALSAPGGRVAISWETKSDVLSLVWREERGPPVTAPARQGFGSRLVASAFRPDQGKVSVAYEPAGVQCRVELRI
ncbi:MAG TPA: sensor histidine kinase [Roseiarcus sp.]|nr:sensor histidine kinase [Roseiarcus sp.]